MLLVPLDVHTRRPLGVQDSIYDVLCSYVDRLRSIETIQSCRCMTWRDSDWECDNEGGEISSAIPKRGPVSTDTRLTDSKLRMLLGGVERERVQGCLGRRVKDLLTVILWRCWIGHVGQTSKT